MTDDLDRFLEELQRQIDEEAQSVYSDRVIQEFSDPKHVGRLAEPDAHAIVRGGCGDTMEIYLRKDGERITEASFMTDGCGPTVACGSLLTAMVRGLSPTEAKRISPQRLIDTLDGLPEESVHCAELAVATLRKAIDRLLPIGDGASVQRPT